MKKSNMCLLRLLLFPFALLGPLGPTGLKYILRKKDWLGQENVLETAVKFVKLLWKRDTFQSFVDKKVYKINHRFTCSDKCLVVKFVDDNILVKTVDEFRYRWNNYKDNKRKSVKGVYNVSKLGIFADYPKFRQQRFPARH